MKSKPVQTLGSFIEAHIPAFHENRLRKLDTLKLKDVLLRKNPYLFRAKNILSASELVESLLAAHLSSQEETLFGSFLEQIAIHVCADAYGGAKSDGEGIDLSFVREKTRYIVSIKSGPNWGNSSQIKKMADNFKKAKKILGSNTRATQQIVAVNGCCYGKESGIDKGDYLKLCGQDFWELISGQANLYADLIGPVGFRAKQHNDEFTKQFHAKQNKLVREFANEFCSEQGAIDWDKLLEFNSGSTRLKT
jgi:Type II restriction endonuclease EcoO109I